MPPLILRNSSLKFSSRGMLPGGLPDVSYEESSLRSFERHVCAVDVVCVPLLCSRAPARNSSRVVRFV